MPQEDFNRNLKKEILFKSIDQLHHAVSQRSNFCFEIKKFCISTLFVVLAFVTTLTDETLDISIFIITCIIILCFWFSDATSYYYQVKLRGIMNDEVIEIENLYQKSTSGSLDENGFSIEEKRVNISNSKKVLKALFNHSMWIYAILIGLDILALVCFLKKIIQ